MSQEPIRVGRRGVLAGLGATALAVGLTACGNGGKESTGSASPAASGSKAAGGDRGPITYATGKDTTGKLQKFLEKWNSAHPDEKVTLIELPESADEQRNQMVQNAQAKSDAFTVLGLDVVWTAEFAANKWIQELPKDKFKLDDFLKATVDTSTYYDKLYAVPFTTNGQLLFSRKDLLEEAGFKNPPKTFEEMYKMIDAVKAKHPEMKGFGSQFFKYEGLTCQMTGAAKSSGTELFSSDGKPQVDKEGPVKALQTLREGFDKGYMPKEALTYKEEESRQAFQDGNLIFVQNWPYVWEKFEATDGSSKVNGKVVASVVPGITGAGSTTVGGLNLGLSAFAKHKDTALDFIAFLTAPEQQKEWHLETSNPAARTSVYNDADLKKKYEFLDTLKTAVDTGASRPKAVRYPAVSQAIQDAAYKTISGEGDAAGTMKDLQAKLTELTK